MCYASSNEVGRRCQLITVKSIMNMVNQVQHCKDTVLQVKFKWSERDVEKLDSAWPVSSSFESKNSFKVSTTNVIRLF